MILKTNISMTLRIGEQDELLSFCCCCFFKYASASV